MSKFNELIKSSTPTIVNFYAEWAPNSDEFTAVLKSIKTNLEIDTKMVRIDFDKNESLANKLKIIGVPSVVIFKEGKIIYRATGSIDEEILLGKIVE